MPTVTDFRKDRVETGGQIIGPLAGNRVHFVGIGGCGMSGLARVIQGCGAICTGTDIADTQVTRGLRSAGIPVSLEQTRQAVPTGCDLLVTSAAIRSDHPEVTEARARGVRVVKYAQMLGRLMADRTGVAVAGTHGKSTVTAMLSHVLLHAGLDPSFVMGADCAQIGGGSRWGHGDLFVVEACEFDRSFLNLWPRRAVFLNIEEDHLDVYGSLDGIIEAFTELAGRLPAESDGGYLLIDHDAPGRGSMTRGLHCRVETIGFGTRADWRVVVEPGAGRQVDIVHRGQTMCRWTNPLPGRHMAYNAAAAGVMAYRSGTDWGTVTQALQTFQGLDRRVQVIGTRPASDDGGDITVVDDYGHHPTEIRATLQGLRKRYQPRRMICVFQPHQHSRTRSLLARFAGSFEDADSVIVPDIYSARDTDAQRRSVGSSDLVDQIRRQHPDAVYVGSFTAVVDRLNQKAKGGDLVVTMGAGDVWKIAQRYVRGSVRSEGATGPPAADPPSAVGFR